MSAQHTSGAQIVLDALVNEGVDVAFGYPGGTIMPVHDAFYTEKRIRHILVRHEQGAAFAAGGYARSTGKVGVCIATSGPGATNLVTGICDAMMDSVPVVAITGQVRSPLMGTDGFQEADVAAITSTITKRNIVVRDIDSIAPAIHAAFELARGPRPGPVLVDIPTDVLRTKIEVHASPNATANGYVNGVRTNGASDLDEASIESAVELICESKRPLVIVGGGARISDAVESYREFMRLLDTPHTSTINGLGMAEPGDPKFLGMCGMHGWKAANKAIGECDLILALGMRFDDRVTGRTDRFARQAKIIHADIDASEFNKIITVDVALHGDLDATLRELTARLADRMIPDFSAWRTRVEELHAPLPTDPTDGQLSATDVLDAFFDLAPANVVVAVDVGQHQMWAAQRAHPAHPRHFVSSSGLGAMGFGLPASIGAQLAHPEKPVVAIVGDGGLQMSMNEFATIVRHELPLKILLIDNRNLGMVRQWQQLFYEKRYSATSLYDNPDFVMVAKAYGIDGLAVDNHEDLRPAIAALLRSERPMILHAKCFPNECVFPMIPAGAAIDEMIDARPV
jgi:acetolactate synthase I/II/III large subunit